MTKFVILFSDILEDRKRLDLLMQIFLFSSATSRRVALKKLLTWWHFIVMLKDRASVQFEKVPFFRSSKSGSQVKSGSGQFDRLFDSRYLVDSTSTPSHGPIDMGLGSNDS